MRTKLIVIAVTVMAGFLSGYYSDPIQGFVSKLELPELKLSRMSWFSEERRPGASSRSDIFGDQGNDVHGSITGDAAVNAVKALPAVKQMVSAAASQGYQLFFRADQPPTSEYPVWLVEVRQVYPNQIPDILFLKVDGFSGKVLDVQKAELETTGFTLASPLPASRGTGKPQVKYVYNESLKRKVRLEKYKGFEVEADRNKEVIRITVTGEELKGPREITVGTGVGDVIKKFGKANIAQRDLLIFNSIEDKHMQLHIKIAGERVSSFSMVKIFE